MSRSRFFIIIMVLSLAAYVSHEEKHWPFVSFEFHKLKNYSWTRASNITSLHLLSLSFWTLQKSPRSFSVLRPHFHAFLFLSILHYSFFSNLFSGSWIPSSTVSNLLNFYFNKDSIFLWVFFPQICLIFIISCYFHLLVITYCIS